MYIADSRRFSNMLYRHPGRNGVLLPVLSLGLRHYFEQDRPADRRAEVLREAFDLGVTHFDVAGTHGPRPGTVESAFGRVLSTDFATYRHELVISARADSRYSSGQSARAGLLLSLDRSLRRLRTDYVDVFYVRPPGPSVPAEETVEALRTAVRQGKVLHAGLLDHTPEQVATAVGMMTGAGIPVLLHQFCHSTLYGASGRELLLDLSEAGVGGMVRVPATWEASSHTRARESGGAVGMRGDLPGSSVLTRALGDSRVTSVLLDVARTDERKEAGSARRAREPEGKC
ncbi:aldo/keto reductase [Streptomyces sp. NPDC002911]